MKEEDFKNVETWALAVWFEMNELAKTMIRRTSWSKGAREIKRWCHEFWTDGVTPFGHALTEVEWYEIDTLWEKETQQIVTDAQKAIDYRIFKEWHEC